METTRVRVMGVHVPSSFPSRLWLAIASGFAAAGCVPDPVTEVEYAPFQGEAYPANVPEVAWPAAGALLVTNSFDDTLSVVDGLLGVEIDRRPVGRNPIDLDGPHHVAVDVAGGRAFIALSYPEIAIDGPHASHGASAASGYVQALDLARLLPIGVVRIEANPGDIVLSPDGSRLVVSHFDLARAIENPTDIDAARASIAVLDPESVGQPGAPPPRFIPTCVAPHGVVLGGPTGATAFVACYGEDRLAVVDLDDPAAEIQRFDVGPGVAGFGAPTFGPYALALSPDGGLLAVSSTASKDVRFFDVGLSAFDLTRTVTMFGAPFFPAFDAAGARLVVPTQQPDALVVVDLADVAAPQVRPFEGTECVLPHAVILDGADGYFVVCEGDKETPGKVLHLDALLAIVGTVDVGLFPDAVVPVPGGAAQ